MRNFKMVARVAAVLTASLTLAACGADDAAVTSGVDDATADVSSALNGADVATDDAAQDAATQDAATDAASDVVYSDAPFETASHYALPQLVYGNMGVLHHPHLVTVTFSSDPFADQLEKFGSQLQNTSWWDTWSTAYCSSSGSCVGKGDSDQIRLGLTAAKSYTDTTATPTDPTKPYAASTIQQFIATQLDNATLPAPVTDTVYVIYFPQGTQITLADGAGQPSSKSCQTFGGYHHSLPYGGNQVAYAVLPECKNGDPGMTQVESVLFAASHEIAEASTDPYTNPNPNASPYGGFNINVEDENVLAWVFALGGGEVADLCPNLPYGGFGYATTADTTPTYKVTRVWSNVAAKANHNPCVPADPGPYFNMAPEKNKGTHVQIELGASATIALHAFSDMPVQPWSVTAIDIDSFQGGGTALSFDFDGQASATVNNGDVINMTITRDPFAKPAAAYGAIGMIVSTSADGQSTNYWPIWSYTKAELGTP